MYYELVSIHFLTVHSLWWAGDFQNIYEIPLTVR